MKQPKFISGPPGTGKTSMFITRKYTELLNKYSYDKIIILSHTNVAADEIRDEILKLPQMKDVTKKSMKHKICTIHSYCRSKLSKKEVISYQDHVNLTVINTLFKRQSVNEGEFNNDKHKFYRYLADAKGKGKNLTDHWKTCDKPSYKPYDVNTITKMKKIYDQYKKDHQVCDYADMIEEFTDKAVEPDIKALIVDEAQDSNVPQRKALDKMATNTEEYYFVGDADQTIFEFAGSDSDYYHRLSKDAEQLEQGHRCGRTINNLCKSIIKPIWDYYGYDRIWKPTDVEGNHYYLPSLKNNCTALEKLLNKIHNTTETFLFTYRGNPSDIEMRKFFKKHGIEFAHVGNSPYVSKKEIKCHKYWPDFVKGKPMDLKQIKDFWNYMGSKVIMHGRGDTKCFDEWINKPYTIDYLIDQKYLKADSVQYNDFALTRTQTDPDRILYIRKVLNKDFVESGDVRVKYANIHTVKGLTFDNVIVDLTRTRKEEYFTQLRLKYVAYSRGRVDCWTIASRGPFTLGEK